VNLNARLIITIDVEGDNLWANPSCITTENARYLPRFQDLCESYEFKPTYLVDYEMASDPFFQDFGRNVIRRGAAEVGMHLHAWNTPPLSQRDGSQSQHIYITELPDEVMYEKMEFMTSLLRNVFHVKLVSHRAGRWGFDERVARVLSKLGYLVDCSVTPGVSWCHQKGDPHGNGGPDYDAFKLEPYFLDPANIRLVGKSNILEVPVTIRSVYPKPITMVCHTLASQSTLFARAIDKLARPCVWLRPNGHNVGDMIKLIDWALSKNLPVLEFVLHSSELVQGGSPNFREKDHIEKLYDDLDIFFCHVSARQIKGATLAEYRQTFRRNG
jgi:hypothetical protein